MQAQKRFNDKGECSLTPFSPRKHPFWQSWRGKMQDATGPTASVLLTSWMEKSSTDAGRVVQDFFRSQCGVLKKNNGFYSFWVTVMKWLQKNLQSAPRCSVLGPRSSNGTKQNKRKEKPLALLRHARLAFELATFTTGLNAVVRQAVQVIALAEAL